MIVNSLETCKYGVDSHLPAFWDYWMTGILHRVKSWSQRPRWRRVYATRLKPYVGQLAVIMEETRMRYRELTGTAPTSATDITCSKRHLGLGDGRWCMCPELIDEGSVIYSVGVGYDISFDRALIRRFGCQVHAFDPTRLACDWLATLRLPDRFSYHQIGLAGYDGEAEFRLPENYTVSFTPLANVKGHSHQRATVCRLQTLMDMLGHEQIDILKIDIEGGEFEVIDDLVASRANIGQLLIEFHARFIPESGEQVMTAALEKLRSAGFRLFHVFARGIEYSFLGPHVAARKQGNPR